MLFCGGDWEKSLSKTAQRSRKLYVSRFSRNSYCFRVIWRILVMVRLFIRRTLENCLVGMNAVVMDNAKIGDECIIGALSFVPTGFISENRKLIVGSPAKIIREVSDEMIAWKTKEPLLIKNWLVKVTLPFNRANRTQNL